MASAVYFLTGSSGSGKTTLLKKIAGQLPSNVAHYHFDNDRLTLGGWLTKAINSEADLVIFDGSVKPSDVRQAADRAGLPHLKTVLVDCSHDERKRRLVEERKQPGLDHLDMYAWAAYLRGQADVLGLEIIDTTSLTIDEGKNELLRSVINFLGEVPIR